MRKAWVGIVATIAILSAAGVGFAAFTSSVYVNATASTGNVNLLWVAPSSSIPFFLVQSGPIATCSATLASPVSGPAPYAQSSTTIAFTTSGFAPGDQCVINDGVDPGVLAVINLGGLSATLSEVATCSVNGGTAVAVSAGTGPDGGYTCGYFEFYDAEVGFYATLPATLAPATPTAYWAAVDLPLVANQVTSLQSVTFQVTLTGTAT